MTDKPSNGKPVIARVTHQFQASPERVFDAFLDPTRAAKFMFATPTGQMVRAETDPRVGGTYTFVDRRDGEDVAHTGEYLEIDRPRRLVFTLLVPRYAQSADRVTIELVPRGDGCQLTLTHEMGPHQAEFKSRTEEGWRGILEKVATVLG
jgi:uncharacterized protein YndB with AHSA1/START domain